MRNAYSRAVIDHLVFGCDHLKNGTSFLEQTLGVGFSGGGKHTLMATHNRLLKLQDSIYSKPSPLIMRPCKNMWILVASGFSLDEDRTKQRLAQSPRPLTWVVAVDDIYDGHQNAGMTLEKITAMTRGDLEWMLTIAEDGTLVEELLPGLIQWPGGRNQQTNCQKAAPGYKG